jgi:MFS family permease
MELTEKYSKINFNAFLWHSAFLALASNFMDVDTIIPSMLIKAGGTSIHLGFLTAIMLGGSSLFQLVFAAFLSHKALKKNYLLLGINLRVLALFSLSFLFFKSAALSGSLTIILIFLFISIFSFSGSFAGVSYTDILGKAVKERKRLKFFSTRQVINSIGIFSSAVIVRKMIRFFEYPINYSVLFLFAGILLFIATFGFWMLKEPPSNVKEKRGLIEFFRLIPSEIKKNPNLKYYLLIINSLGLGLSILPFVILYAKINFGLSYHLIGNFLFFRTTGMLTAGIILFKYSKRIKYKSLLKISLILGALPPLLSLIFSDQQAIYQLIFIVSGIFASSYTISVSGVLLEISTNENRAIYAGISGAGNILTTIFPLFSGFLIALLGYKIVFISVASVVMSSYLFVSKLHCRPEA